jgi:hypothetical protein
VRLETSARAAHSEEKRSDQAEAQTPRPRRS